MFLRVKMEPIFTDLTRFSDAWQTRQREIILRQEDVLFDLLSKELDSHRDEIRTDLFEKCRTATTKEELCVPIFTFTDSEKVDGNGDTFYKRMNVCVETRENHILDPVPVARLLEESHVLYRLALAIGPAGHFRVTAQRRKLHMDSQHWVPMQWRLMLRYYPTQDPELVKDLTCMEHIEQGRVPYKAHPRTASMRHVMWY